MVPLAVVERVWIAPKQMVASAVFPPLGTLPRACGLRVRPVVMRKSRSGTSRSSLLVFEADLCKPSAL